MDIDFKALFGGSPNPYVLLDRDFVIVEMNDAYLKATMRDRADIIGRRMFDAFPSDPQSQSFQLLDTSLRRVVDTGKRDELALIRYDIAAPDGGVEERYWSATHIPLHGPDGQTAYILQHTVDVTELHRLRQMAQDSIAEAGVDREEAKIFARASAVQESNLTLAGETEQFRRLFEQAPGFVAVLTGPEHRFQMANAAYRQLVGHRDIIGRPLDEALPEVMEQGFGDLLNDVMASGNPFVGEAVQVFLQSKPDAPLEERFLDFIYQPILGKDGKAIGVFVQGHDVTKARRADEHQSLLINELNHRVKNTLAIVQALAMQSFRDDSDPKVARQVFDARLNALSAAHNLLTAKNWENASLREIFRVTIAATAGSAADRVSVDGPDIALVPQTAVSLAMAVHELATNAIKYGALSNERGTVDVHWTEEPAERDMITLTLVWAEAGGPPVEAPTRRGFGTRLIERGLSAELKSNVRLDFDRDGLRCTIVATLPDAPL